jgi:hypothetical protein
MYKVYPEKTEGKRESVLCLQPSLMDYVKDKDMRIYSREW